MDDLKTIAHALSDREKVLGEWLRDHRWPETDEEERVYEIKRSEFRKAGDLNSRILHEIGMRERAGEK